MKHLLFITSFIFCLLISNKASACSPIKPDIADLIAEYNNGNLSLVEGYFVPSKTGIFTSTFVVTRSSDANIKPEQAYYTLEYGPFGSQCEDYEMEVGLDNKEAQKNKLRVLFVYKDRSKNGKLVTPIFWGSGIKIVEHKLIIKGEKEEYDSKKDKFIRIRYQYSIPYIVFWKQILENRKLNFDDWKKEEIIEK